VRSIAPEANTGFMERTIGHPLMTVTDVYEATGNEVYLRTAARLVDWTTKWENGDHPGGMLSNIFEQPAYYSGCPFNGGLLSAGLMKFNNWARQPELDGLLDRMVRWTLTDVWAPPIGLFSKGGAADPTPGSAGIASHSRAIVSSYQRTRDPLLLAVSRRLVEKAWAGEKGEMIGSRKSGLVLSHVPWLLALYANEGNPTFEPGLTVVPGQAITAKAASKTPVCFQVTNNGTTPATRILTSVQPRMDFKIANRPTVPKTLKPGQSVDVCYGVVTPQALNLNSITSRSAAVHFALRYERDGQPHLGQATAQMSLVPDEATPPPPRAGRRPR
jgi:hypothetical protein